MECLHCHAQNTATAVFCDQCGSRLEVGCPSCGESNRPGANFCNRCGAPLPGQSQATPSGPAHRATPERYTPKSRADKILTSREALEGERKLVTNLFADIKGSMELLAERDPEEAHQLLDPVVERMMQAVHRYEGTVTEVRGDGIMAIFGAPLAHEDHAQRACYAALDMQSAIKRYAAEVMRTHGVRAQIRVGLNSGEVVVRAIGSDLRMDYATVGQSTHLAARMEQLAEPGSTLLSANTLRLAEGYIEVKTLGAMPVKGLAEPVEVYELIGAGPNRSRLRAAAERGLSHFVGREAELEQLRGALDRSSAARGEVVAIVGEAGVGKSRLVWELVHSHRTEGWLVVQASSASYGRATPYLPIVDLLRNYFQIDSNDDHRTIREKVIGKLLILERALEPLAPALLVLMDVAVADAEWNELDSRQRRRRTLDAVKRVLLKESELQPLLVVVEDLHWIDSETQACLDLLVESIPTARLLLVVNYRPEYEHHWGGRTYYRQIGLDPLPQASAEALLSRLVGDDPSLDAAKELLVERTQGNPFFLEESVRSLIESGVFSGEPGAYNTAKVAGSVLIPPTVHAVIAARIDRLSGVEKQLLATAAVIGKVVPLALLKSVTDHGEHELRTALERLQVTEFLYETALYPDIEYTFKHALTQEVAYGTLLSQQRHELHRQIVGAIERVYVTRLAEQTEKLAHHSFLGEQWDRAVGFLREAGAKAAGRSTYPEAVGFLEQALVAVGHLPQSRESLQQGIDLRFALRSALQALGEHERVFEHLRAAETLASRLGDQDRLGWACAYLSQYLWRMGDPLEARAVGERALEIAAALDSRALKVVADFFMGQGHFNVGDYRRAIAHCEASLDGLGDQHLYDRLGLTGLPAVLSHTFCAWSRGERGEFEAATVHAGQAIDIGHGIRHPYDMAAGHLALGHVGLLQGDLDTALAALETTLTLCRDCGLSVILPTAAALLALGYALSGRVQDALLLLTESGTHGPQRQILIFDTSTATIAPAAVYLVAGRLTEARLAADRAVETAVARGFRANEAWAVFVQGEAVAGPDPHAVDSDCAPVYHRALELADEIGMRPLAAHVHLRLGALYDEAGDEERAATHAAQAAALYGSMGMEPWTMSANRR